MNNLLIGGKTSLVSALLVSISFVVAWYTQAIWYPWQQHFSVIIPIYALAIAVFAIQFNHSRFVLLLVPLCLIALSGEHTIDSQWAVALLEQWQSNADWQLLSALGFISYLSWIKERSLFSIHLTVRLFAAVVVIALAYYYLAFIAYLALQFPELIAKIDIQWLNIYLPVTLLLLATLAACLLSTSLVNPALFISQIIFVIDYFSLSPLSWLATTLLLLSYYFLSIVASSYFLAYRDELTRLPSRRALFQLALSLGRKYSVAMIDIDHFKKFNDTYGHDVGDQVLKLVASKLSKVKSGGRVFRYGGEEFTVIFPRKNAEQVLAELEKLRQSVADYQMVIRKPDRKSKSKENRKGNRGNNQTSVSVTISIGVATREKKQNFEQVMKFADQKLYQAKKNGRNNVCN